MRIIIVIIFFLLLNLKIHPQISDDKINNVIIKIDEINLSSSDDELVLSLLDSAFQFINIGNVDALKCIIRLSERSDGYVSAFLGFSFGELLLNNFDLYMNLMHELDEDDQELVGSSAFYMDGGGMNPADYNKVELMLQKVILNENDKNIKIAKLHLKLLNLIKSEYSE